MSWIDNTPFGDLFNRSFESLESFFSLTKTKETTKVTVPKRKNKKKVRKKNKGVF
tara:strand:- start:4026 stop:4190 length:165 start_codon:yes stop_codon:yes gene_type:complete